VILHRFCFSFRDFVVLVRRCFIRSSSLCDVVCVSYFVQVFVRFILSDDPVHIKSMILESSTLQIRRHRYSGGLNIVICVSFSTLSFYVVNMNVVSLLTDSSFLFLANFHCIDVLYQFEWMNIVFFCWNKKIFLFINFIKS